MVGSLLLNSVDFAQRAKNRAARDLKKWLRFLTHEHSEHRLARSFADLEPGTAEWLVAAERHYGGYVDRVKRRKVSPNDPRKPEEIATGGMIGGDRMSAQHHGYAAKYAEYLLPAVRSGRHVVLVEVGILKGSGLATWSDLFPKGRIIGFDIDLSHTRANMENLKARGAFKNSNMELHEFDQLLDNRSMLRNILGRDKIDVLIDDGAHTEAAILATMRSVQPHLAEDFVYLIEDNETVASSIAAEFPDLTLDRCGELTVATPS